MTEEYEQLSLRVLCMRMSYGVMISRVVDDYISKAALIKGINRNGTILIEYEPFDDGIPNIDVWNICEIKPYLRPMSSMTEEEKKELNNILEYQYYSDDNCMCESTNWLDKNRFDYRGLIKKGLALEAPEGMYK